MNSENKKQALIVEQVPSLNDGIEKALRILAAEHGIDIYTCRQKILGGGLAHFGSGPLGKVKPIAALLEQQNLKTWIIQPSRPLFGPQRLRSLEITDDEIIFTTPKDAVSMTRNAQVIAVLADISGSVVDKQLKRMMVQNVYQGTADNARLNEQETRRAILMGQPVLDLYRVSDKEVSTIVRVLPGKFDPAGLGEQATLSARGNIGVLLKVCEEYFPDFTLHTGYGLSQLPGCHLKKEADGSDWQIENLKQVIRFGWLMTDLALQPQPHKKTPAAPEGASPGTVAAATLLGRPELATTGALNEMPGIGEVIDEIDQSIAEKSGEKEQEEKIDRSLPMPPEPTGRRLPLRAILLNVAAFALIGSFIAFSSGHRLPGQILQYGFRLGLFQAAGAVLLFWVGFSFFLLKRHIENTPTSKIRSLAMGMVEIHGYARRKYALVAPMTSTPCVYYRLRTYRREQHGKNQGTWRLKSDTSSGHVPFYVEDQTGRVTVDPDRASVRAGTRQEGSPGQGNILLGGGSSYDSNEKWVEEVIHEGAFLYILGDARLQKQKRKSLNELKIEKLRNLKLDRAAMQKYDVDGDGQIDADEWQQARDDVEDQVLREQLATRQEAAKQEDAIVIGH
ncbi:MAG: hypothetical protein C0623_01875 [Desulfuromonas sp.]|nr:MAG: hypothetical protein C0623_01875 [Desulfuromonas sp.]